MNFNHQLKHFKLLTPTSAFAQRVTSIDSGASVHHARLVYSWLAYRSRIGHGASNRSLIEEFCIHHNSVAAAIRGLGDLVVRRGNEWIAVEPPESLFVPMKRGEQSEQWPDRIAYTMLYLPMRGAKIEYSETSRRFRINHAIIWSYLVGNAKNGVVRGFTFAGTGKMFGINAKTVASIVDDLLWLKLLTREDYGRGSNITLLPNNDVIREYFQPIPEKPLATNVEAVEKKPPSAPAAYQLMNDIWDQGRKLCQPLMPQSTCDAIIMKALKLGDSPQDFENAVIAAKELHDANLVSGKVTKGNFGKYLSAIYDTRIAAVDEQLKKQIEQKRQEEYLDSDEFKQKQKQTELDAAADPLHPRHFLTPESILDRVQFDNNPVKSFNGEYDLTVKIRKHIREFICSTGKKLWVEDENNEVARIYSQIMKPALAALNGYYRKPKRATFDELKQEITLAIAQRFPNMPPMFPETDLAPLSTVVVGVDIHLPVETPS
jgi:hypothetical protein